MCERPPECPSGLRSDRLAILRGARRVAPEVGINPLNSHRRWLVPLRGHGGFHLETGIMGKASPCPLRMFYGTVRGPMVRKSKKRIPFTDAVEEATYRCDICDIEATRTVKDP